MESKIYYNAQIITMEEECPNAQAMYIEEGRIRNVGNDDEIMTFKKEDTILIDVEQKVIMPGFIDTHSHLSSMIFHYLLIDIGTDKCKTIEDIIEVLKQEYTKNPPNPNEWLIGWGYDNIIFEDGKHPTKYDLNKISTSVPIMILHVSGQCAVCNSPALKVFGYVGKDFKVPTGGVVEKVKEDTSGLIIGNALYDKDVIPFPAVEKIICALQKAIFEYVSNGITTVQDARTGGLEYVLLKNLANLNKLPVDVISYVTKDTLQKVKPAPVESICYQNRYRIGGYKMELDGSPHLRTAWLSKPYYIVPEQKADNYRGFPFKTDQEVEEECMRCIENEWQINVHCNGDAACDQFLEVYEKAMNHLNNKKELRPVLIHAQIIREDQLEKIKELKMIPSFFIDHIYFSGDFYHDTALGALRAKKVCPLKSTFEKGVIFTMHQNAPVISPKVLFSIHNAVNRTTRKNRVLGEEEQIAIEEALKAVTIHGAYQIYEENEKGSIKAGKKADFIILNKNPYEEEKLLLKEIIVMETIKEGITVYKREKDCL